MGDEEFSNLVELLEGQNRRFRRLFAGEDPGNIFFPSEDQYTEWQFRPSTQEMLDLLDRSPGAADFLLQNFLLAEPRCGEVVWFSRTHAIFCEGPEVVDELFPFGDFYTVLTLHSNDSRVYRLKINRHESVDSLEEALHVLQKIVALGTHVMEVVMHRDDRDHSRPRTVPGIQDFVSLARSRRTVKFRFGISWEVGRILAYHCSPMVELETWIDDWSDEGQALVEAMLANQGPSRLALGFDCDDSGELVAPALASTTCIEELTICLPIYNGVVWDAVVRNRGVRALAARCTGRWIDYGQLHEFWKAALTNGAVSRIDASEIFHGLLLSQSTDPRDCSEMIATMIRSNPRITAIRYNPRAYDAHIMETRVMPIVHFNRFRPIVTSTFGGGSSAAGRGKEKNVSALIGSPLVRRHPELLYFLLKMGRDCLLLTPTDAGRRRRASTQRSRKRGRRR